MRLSLRLFSVPACMASSSRSSSGWWAWMFSLRQFVPACSANPVLAHDVGHGTADMGFVLIGDMRALAPGLLAACGLARLGHEQQGLADGVGHPRCCYAEAQAPH